MSASNSSLSTRLQAFVLGLRWVTLFFFVVVCGAETARANAPEPAPSLLEQAKIVAVSGVSHPDRLTDRIIAVDGDFWHTDITAAFRDPNGSVTWDLGKEVAIHSAYLQGDNNDYHFLTISSDNVTYRPLWNAPLSDSPGMRDRFTRSLNATGRYIRVQARGGDRAYALSEVRVSSDAAVDLGSQLTSKKGTPVEEQLQDHIIWFGIAAALCILFTRRQQQLWMKLGLVGLTVAVGSWCFATTWELWPLGQREISLLRAVAAAIALLAVLREALASRKMAADTRVVRGALTVSATLADIDLRQSAQSAVLGPQVQPQKCRPQLRHAGVLPSCQVFPRASFRWPLPGQRRRIR